MRRHQTHSSAAPRVGMQVSTSTLVASCLLAGLVLGLGLAAVISSEALSAEGDAGSRSADAPLRKGLEVNLNYCQEWLDGKDFKTLEKTAHGVGIVVHLLAQKSDDAAWQQGTRELADATGKLVAAARQQQADASRTLIAGLRKQLSELPDPTGNPLAATRPQATLRSVMDLLEGTLADAKTNLAVGDVDGAKSSAAVLSELGGVVSNYRNGGDWSRWSEQFAKSAEAVARSSSSDARELRALLKTVHEACENCHDRRGR